MDKTPNIVYAIFKTIIQLESKAVENQDSYAENVRLGIVTSRRISELQKLLYQIDGQSKRQKKFGSDQMLPRCFELNLFEQFLDQLRWCK